MSARTANGVQITPGLRIWTNDLTRATVIEGEVWQETNRNPSHPLFGQTIPWFPVQDDNGRTDHLDGSRMTTRHPFTGEVA